MEVFLASQFTFSFIVRVCPTYGGGRGTLIGAIPPYREFFYLCRNSDYIF
jgi:hypothetical protein